MIRGFRDLRPLRNKYKIISGKVDMDSGKFFESAREARTKVYQYKLFNRLAGSFGSRSFSARIVDSWNKLKTKHWGPEWWKNLRLP